MFKQEEEHIILFNSLISSLSSSSSRFRLKLKVYIIHVMMTQQKMVTAFIFCRYLFEDKKIKIYWRNRIGGKRSSLEQADRMTKNLNKITKKLSKKKGKLDSLHEKSRDAVRLRRAGGREEKLARAAASTMKGRQTYGELYVVCAPLYSGFLLC